MVENNVQIIFHDFVFVQLCTSLFFPWQKAKEPDLVKYLVKYPDWKQEVL